MKKILNSYFLKKNQGLSLMEMLIYVGIIGIVASVATSIFLSVTKIQTEQSAQVEISGQLNFAMQTIQRLIKDSSLIDINPGTPTNFLTLRMKNTNSDPTIIYLENGRIYVKEGASGNPQSITSDKVIVDSLEFKKLTQYPGKDVVQIDLAMSATNKVEGRTITRSLRSAVSRASAAVFDSDLLPGADNTYSVGSSNRWKNASFSGNVGIGVTTLLNKLDIAGGVAIGSYAGVNTAPSNGLIISGNIGIGTPAPEEVRLDIHTSNTNEIGLLLRDNGGARLFTVTELGNEGYNPISSAGDIGLIYHGNNGQNTGSLVISQWSNSAKGIKIDTSGNVGIGVRTPGERLEVAGNIKLSGTTPTYKITNVAAPTASSDVATKDYVDAALGSSSLNVYAQKSGNLLGKYAGLVSPHAYDDSRSAQLIFRRSSGNQNESDWLIYDEERDNNCDLINYINSSTKKLEHFRSGDCSTVYHSRWYYSTFNCSSNPIAAPIFDLAVYAGNLLGDAYNNYHYCISSNFNEVFRYFSGSSNCDSRLGSYFYRSYRDPETGICYSMTGNIYGYALDSTYISQRKCGVEECTIE